MATKVKAVKTEFDFERIEKELLQKISVLNTEYAALGGVYPVSVTPVSERGSVTEMVKLEYLEDLKNTCTSLKVDIHAMREEIQMRVNSLTSYLAES